MIDWRMVKLLRDRAEPFRAGITLLLKGHDTKANFVRATRQILQIVADWQSHSSMEAEAPRRAKIAWHLREVERDCARLQQSLRPLCEYLDDYMELLAPPGLMRTAAVFKYFAKADISGFSEYSEFNNAGLLIRVQALRDFCRESLRAARKKESGDHNWLGSDRGGRSSSVFKEHYGSAKWQLVHGSARLFCDYQNPTATDGGPFHEFCRATYELASGRSDPDDSVGLRRSVQFAAPRVRSIAELNTELLNLRYPDPLRPFRSLPPNPAREERIRQLEAEIKVLQSELARGPRRGGMSTAG